MTNKPKMTEVKSTLKTNHANANVSGEMSFQNGKTKAKIEIGEITITSIAEFDFLISRLIDTRNILGDSIGVTRFALEEPTSD